MDLSGVLSNRQFSDFVHFLTSLPSRQDPPNKSKAGYSDGRREFGSVGKAVLTVLAAADHDLTAREIKLEAEKLLGSPVSRHSIAYQLQTKSKGTEPTIIQTNGRYYRLRR